MVHGECLGVANSGHTHQQHGAEGVSVPSGQWKGLMFPSDTVMLRMNQTDGVAIIRRLVMVWTNSLPKNEDATKMRVCLCGNGPPHDSFFQSEKLCSDRGNLGSKWMEPPMDRSLESRQSLWKRQRATNKTLHQSCGIQSSTPLQSMGVFVDLTSSTSAWQPKDRSAHMFCFVEAIFDSAKALLSLLPFSTKFSFNESHKLFHLTDCSGENLVGTLEQHRQTLAVG